MAVQHGPIWLTGQLGGVSYYEMGGKYYARVKTAHTAERIRTDPAFTRTHQNSRDFGKASSASLLIREAWANVAVSFADNRMHGRLNGRFVKVLQADTAHACGSRTLADGDLTQLQGFELNKYASFSAQCPFSPAVTIDRAGRSVALRLSSSLGELKDSHSHAQLVIGIVCVNFQKKTHTAYRYQLPLAGFRTAFQQPAVFEAPACADPQSAVIVMLGISPGTASEGALAPQGNAMAIVSAEAAVVNSQSSFSATTPVLHPHHRPSQSPGWHLQRISKITCDSHYFTFTPSYIPQNRSG